MNNIHLRHSEDYAPQHTGSVDYISRKRHDQSNGQYLTAKKMLKSIEDTQAIIEKHMARNKKNGQEAHLAAMEEALKNPKPETTKQKEQQILVGFKSEADNVTVLGGFFQSIFRRSSAPVERRQIA